MKINELSKISGVSIRTLQFYDKNGLLVPKKLENNYREYTDADVDKLQEILFFRKLNFKLKEIKEIMEKDDYSRLEALKFQKEMLEKYLKDLKTVKNTLDESINEMELKLVGGRKMGNNKDKFKGLNFDENPYEAEAREKWGNKVDESKKLINSKSSDEKQAMGDAMNGIFADFAKLVGKNPRDEEVQSLTGAFHKFLNENIGSFYNKEVFKGLGQMYVEDERFTENLDKYGIGTAKLMSEAMVYYSDTKL